MDKNLVDEVVAAAARVVAGGAISANGHGNVSLRVPGAEEMCFTSAPWLRGLGPDGVVRVGLDGTLLEGQPPPVQGGRRADAHGVSPSRQTPQPVDAQLLKHS